MRLVIAGVAVVAGFVVGMLGIARLTPDSPAWVRVALATVWLFGLIAGAYLLGNKSYPRTPEVRRRIRDGFLYLGIGFLVAVVVVAVVIHDLDKGIHRNYRQNWVFCVLTAAVVVGYSVKDFWRFRRGWRMWAVLAVYVTLHFTIGVPALGNLDRIPAWYIWAIGMPEAMLVTFALHLVTATQTAN